MQKFIIKEGIYQIIISLSISIFLMLFVSTFLSIIFLLITLSLIYIYRVPNIIQSSSETILSPLDGKVLAIDKINGQIILYIEKTLCDISLIVSPQNCEMKVVEHKKGLNLNPISQKAKKLNSFVKFKFESLVLEILVGKCNTLLSVENSKEMKQAEKIAVLGSGTVKIILNKDIDTELQIGDRLIIAETILNKI